MDKRTKKTIKNRDVMAAAQGLAAIGRTQLPMNVAVRMAKLRRNLEDHTQAIEETRLNLVNRLRGDATSIGTDHPNWAEFVDQFNEIMVQDYVLMDSFVLYERENGSGPEYSWLRSFKSICKDIEPNTLFGLLPVLDVEPVESE